MGVKALIQGDNMFGQKGSCVVGEMILNPNLAVRWEGMERTAGLFLRSRVLCEVAPRALNAIHSEANIGQTHVAHGRAAGVNGLSFATRATVNAGPVFRNTEEDREAMGLLKLLTSTTSLRRSLNGVQSIDHTVTAVTVDMSVDPEGGECRRLHRDAVLESPTALAGTAGQESVDSYMPLASNTTDDRLG